MDDVCLNGILIMCSVLIDKLMKYRLDELTVSWAESCVNYQAELAVISDTKFSCTSVTGRVPQESIL